MRKHKTLNGALNVLEALNKNKTLDEYVKDAELQEQQEENFSIHFIPPENILRWKYKDRPESELGDIESLAIEMKKIGQQQPCIVRPLPEPDKYELIVGERRWRASLKAQIPLKAIIQDINDNTAAIIQAAENDSRKDLSEYAKGMSLSKLISNNVIKQKDLETRLGKSKQEISRLLSFSRIEPSVLEAIGDMSSVSSRTAYEVSRLSKKGDIYIKALISIAKKIQTGAVGANKLIAAVESYINKKNAKPSLKSQQKKGDFLIWNVSLGKSPTITFPEKTIQLLKEGNITIKQIAEEIKNVLTSSI